MGSMDGVVRRPPFSGAACALLLAGCPGTDSGTSPGLGTSGEDGSSTLSPPTSASSSASDSTSAGTEVSTTNAPTSGTTAATTTVGSSGDDSTSTGDGTPSIPPAEDPGPPGFPQIVDVLTVAVRTSDVSNAGTDANQISICVTETDCQRLNIPDVDDFRRGEIDVYHFPGLGVNRDDIDRVELRSVNGSDAWRPACVEVRLDGEPVHCQDDIEVWMGNENEELGSWIDPGGVTEDCETCYPSKLTHGPMQGALGEDTNRLWVRTEATRPVGLKMGLEPNLDDAPVVAWAYPRPQDDFTAVLEVPQVPAGVDWYYDVEIDGQPMGLGAEPIRMAPSAGTPTAFNFAFGSCSRDVEQPIFTAIEARDPELFLFVGDNHYANSNNLEAVRWFYRRFRKVPPRAALLSHTPTLATWDDHDFVGNNTDGSDPLKANALQAFSEYWANESYGTDSIPGVFHRYGYGDVEFFFVDDRYHRNVEADSMLGTAQREWVVAALSESAATFKFLVAGSVWTEHGSTDSWAAYLTERDQLFDAIEAEAIEGVVLLSGDIHRSQMRWIDPPGDGYPLLELTSSPLATGPGNCANQPDWEYCYEGNSFIEVAVDTTIGDPSVLAIIRDEAGTSLFELETSLSQLQ